jgi:hypothetical protein
MANKRIIYVGVSLSRKTERKIAASAGYRVELSGFLHSKFGSSNLFVRFEIFFRSRKTSQKLADELKIPRSRYVPVGRTFVVFCVFGVSKDQ